MAHHFNQPSIRIAQVACVVMGMDLGASRVLGLGCGPLASFRTFEKSPSARERHSKGPHFVYGDDFNFGLLRYDGARKTLTVSYQDSAGKTLFEQVIG
jgi:hypothetical protein